MSKELPKTPLTLLCADRLLLGMGLALRLICMPSETSGESEFFIHEQLSIGDSLWNRGVALHPLPLSIGTPSDPDLCNSSLKRHLQLCSQKKLLCEGSEHAYEVSI